MPRIRIDKSKLPVGEIDFLVGNMHVDNLAETLDQVCEQNGVPEDQFRAVDLLIFIGVDGAEPGVGRIKDTTLQRFVAEIVHSDGSADHKQVYTREGGFTDQHGLNEFQAAAQGVQVFPDTGDGGVLF